MPFLTKMGRRLPTPLPVCSWPPIRQTYGLMQNRYRIPALTLQMHQLCLHSVFSCLKRNQTSVQRAFWKNELPVSANGSSEPWHQHRFMSPLNRSRVSFPCYRGRKKGLGCLPPGLKLVDCTSHSKVGRIEDGWEDRPTDMSTLPHHQPMWR